MDDLPQSVAGPSLASRRERVGITQAALAQRLGVHRITLRQWERAAEVDPIRADKYERALRAILAEELAKPA